MHYIKSSIFIEKRAMKFFLLAIILFACSPAVMYAQIEKFPEKDGKVYYEMIDSTVKDLSKSQLYNSSKLWVINLWKDKRIIQLDNPDDGMIVGTASFPFYTKSLGAYSSHQCIFSFHITSKDGKYRMQVYDLIISLHGRQMTAEDLNKYASIPNDRKYIKQVNKDVAELMLNLQSSIHHSNESSNF